MPKGPNGERRPADTNACAVMVAKIATGEVEDTKTAKRGSAGGAPERNECPLLSVKRLQSVRQAHAGMEGGET